MLKTFIKVISVILIIFLFNIEISLANTEYLSIKTEKSEENITLIVFNNDKEDIYGFLGDISYDQNKIILEQCTSNHFTLTQNNNLILLESLTPVKDSELFRCSFGILDDSNIDFTINDISLSNGKKLLTAKSLTTKKQKEEKKNQDSKEYSNQNKKKNNIIVILLSTGILIIIILILIKIKTKNKKTIASVFLMLLLLISTIKTTHAFITNEAELDQMRNMLLGKMNNTNTYDFDNDKKTTINDLILGLINYNKPTIIFKNTDVVGTSDYKISVLKTIEILSSNNIEKIYYCFTNEQTCNPNTLYEYKDNSLIKISYPDNVEGQKICLKAVNKQGIEQIVCDNEKYKVDSKDPQVTINNNKVIISEEDTYNVNENITVEYGISGGSHSCTKAYTTGSNKITCTISGHNGLSKTIYYELIIEETIDTIHFVDSLNQNYTTKLVSNDITILESNGKFGIIDFGYKDKEIDAKKVFDYFEKLNIKEFEFAILTHGHSDHIGYFDDISTKYKIKQIYLKERVKKYPNAAYYSGYGKVLSKVKERNIMIKDVENPINQKIVLGDITLNLYNTTFLLNENDVSKADNANSIVAVANIHDKKIYFASDIGEYGILRNGLNVEIDTAKEIGVVDVYKVAHHGYMTYQNSLKSLRYLRPTYSVVTNAENEPQLDGLITRLKFNNLNYKNTYFTSNGHIAMKFNQDGTININQSH